MNEIELDLHGCKVLLVDDTPANLDVLVQSLDKEGFDILVASDGTTALEVAGYSKPDLILLDVMMPGIDGYETCRRLKSDAQVAAIPVIFLTARDDLPGIVEGFESGGVDYVTKPFKKDEVLARIRTHLEKAILARNLAELNERLEQKVKERTRELQLKVSELEGRDRIAEHMLTVHSVEETLAVVLEVVTGILGVDQAVIYLSHDGELKPAAAIGLQGEELSERRADRFSREPSLSEALATAERRMLPVRVEADQPAALVPIVRGGPMLGVIEVENPRNRNPITDGDLRTLGSFALQAAVAIKDAQVHLDPAEWSDQLDEVLELNEEMEEAERLEGLDR